MEGRYGEETTHIPKNPGPQVKETGQYLRDVRESSQVRDLYATTPGTQRGGNGSNSSCKNSYDSICHFRITLSGD